jgi:membrane protease subunit HflC
VSRFLLPLLVLIAIVVALVWGGEAGVGPVIITKENELKLVTRLGNPVQVLTEPGWALRVPLLDEVQTFDRRLQYLNAQAVEILIARNENLLIDYYVVWAIDDPLAFLKNFPGGMKKAEDRIQERVNALVGAKIGGLELSQLLERVELLDEITAEANEQLGKTGVRIEDVRLNRTELPREAEPAAYAQMREQRRAIAREYRVRGERSAREIRAKAERDARTTLADARSFGEVTRGEGDAESAAIYAAAYERDPRFYAFVRSLEAYRKTLGRGTTVVLTPDHEFFRFLGDPSLAGDGTAGSPPPPRER